jgi:hypothetical protein
LGLQILSEVLAAILTSNFTILRKLVVNSGMAKRKIATIALNPNHGMGDRDNLRFSVCHSKTRARWTFKTFFAFSL